MSMYGRPRMTSTHSSTAACIPSSIRCCRTCSASCHPSHQRPRSTSSTHGPPSTPRSHDTRSPTPSGSYLTGLVHHITLRTAFRRTTALAQPCRFGASDSCADPAGDRTQIIQLWRPWLAIRSTHSASSTPRRARHCTAGEEIGERLAPPCIIGGLTRPVDDASGCGEGSRPASHLSTSSPLEAAHRGCRSEAARLLGQSRHADGIEGRLAPTVRLVPPQCHDESGCGGEGGDDPDGGGYAEQ